SLAKIAKIAKTPGAAHPLSETTKIGAGLPVSCWQCRQDLNYFRNGAQKYQMWGFRPDAPQAGTGTSLAEIAEIPAATHSMGETAAGSAAGRHRAQFQRLHVGRHGDHVGVDRDVVEHPRFEQAGAEGYHWLALRVADAPEAHANRPGFAGHGDWLVGWRPM